MTVRIATGPSDVIFDVSDETIQITKILAGQSETFTYGVSGCSATILSELEWLAKNQPGVFRLFWLTLVPWSTVNEIFVHYAEMCDVSL